MNSQYTEFQYKKLSHGPDRRLSHRSYYPKIYTLVTNHEGSDSEFQHDHDYNIVTRSYILKYCDLIIYSTTCTERKPDRTPN